MKKDDIFDEKLLFGGSQLDRNIQEMLGHVMDEEDDGFNHINANIYEGLNDDQVIERIQEGFSNEEVDENSRSVLKIVLSKIFTVFNLICFAIAAIIIARPATPATATAVFCPADI